MAPKKETAPKASVKKAPAKKAPAPKKEVLSEKTVAELKNLAKAKGITGISAMKKADLISALNA